jgi:uncharacterized protein (DUF433 family)
MGEGFAYVNGTYGPARMAQISVLDPGFTRSDAVYDVTSVWKGLFFRIEEHIERFLASCRGVQITCPLSPAEISRILATCVIKGDVTDASYVAVVACDLDNIFYQYHFRGMIDSSKSFLEAPEMPHFERITQNPLVMGGKPCIRGQRVTVSMIVGQIGAGRTIEELLNDYPYLEREDILDALKYAAWRLEEREVELSPS